MSNHSNEATSLFEASRSRQQEQYRDDQPVTPPQPPRRPRNVVAVIGAVLSFVPLVGLVLSIVGLRSSKTRDGVGRTVAIIGIVLSLVLGPAEAYVGMTAPRFDPGCQSANDAALQLRALQSGLLAGDLTALANKLASIHTAFDAAAAKAEDGQARVKLQAVADDVKVLSSDFTAAKQSGDTTRLLGDEQKLQTDGDAADSYCHSF